MTDTSKNQEGSPLLEYFERVAIINLPERRDRRREMECELKAAGIDPRGPPVDFFAGIRVAEHGGWPSRGARGGFLSHYTILKQAKECGLRNVAILEDDCQFEPAYRTGQDVLRKALCETRWDIVEFGHREPFTAAAAGLIAWQAPLMSTYFYAVNGAVLSRLAAFLEAVMSRPVGHPLGGPQYFDGALVMFRQQNPDVISLIAAPSLARQRSSRSDVTPKWFDKWPGLRGVAGRLRQLRQGKD